METKMAENGGAAQSMASEEGRLHTPLSSFILHSCRQKGRLQKLPVTGFAHISTTFKLLSFSFPSNTTDFIHTSLLSPAHGINSGSEKSFPCYGSCTAQLMESPPGGTNRSKVSRGTGLWQAEKGGLLLVFPFI